MNEQETVPPSARRTRWHDLARDLAEAGAFRVGVRPWNWLELGADEAALVWELLAGFVEFLNDRYGVDSATRIPPCWAEHGAVVEELTTLAFSHWQAFCSPEASITDAQSWHNRVLPTFYERLGRWLKGTRIHCDVGRHRDTETTARGDLEAWSERVHARAVADVTTRRERERAARSAARSSEHAQERQS